MGESHKRGLDRRSFLRSTGAAGAAVALADLTAADPDEDTECSCRHTSTRDVVVGVSDAGSVDRVRGDLPDGARVKRRDDDLGYLLVELPITTSTYRQMSYQAEVAGHGDVKYTEPNYPAYALSVDPDPDPDGDDGEETDFGDEPGQPDNPGDGEDGDGGDGGFEDPGLPSEPATGDPLLSEQYAPQTVRATDAWAKTTGSQDVTVAVLDAGVKYDHPDLRDQFGENKGKNVLNPDQKGTDPAPKDLQVETHGTHVAGTVAASIDNDTGVAGMCDARLLSVRALGVDGGGSLDSIVAGIRYAADNGADVINMSLGFPADADVSVPPTLKNAVNYALENGALPVAAAGNDCVERVGVPAAVDGVVAVSAIDDRAEIAPFSNTGEKIDITAPGVNVLSTWTQPPQDDPYGGPYNAISGTSMACPVVSGVAALGKSVDGSMSPDELRQKLKQTAVNIGLPETEQGAGRVDAVGIVGGVSGGDDALGPTAQASVSPTDPYVGEPVICRALDSEDENGYITSWEWTLGDLTRETGERVVHTYDEPGEYTVSLTVTDESGTTAFATETVTVQEGSCSRSPVATEEFSGTVGPSDERSTHTYGLSTEDPCKLQFSIEESLTGGGDRGFILYAVQPSTDFLRTECEDEIFLRPRDLRGLDASADLTVGAFSGSGSNSPAGDYTISVEEYGFAVGESGGGDVSEPAASFTPSGPTVPPGSAVTFDATGSAAPESVDSYEWAMGDGTTATGARVDHAYPGAGEYEVELTITGAGGGTDTATTTVTVSNANTVPDASVSVQPTTAQTGQEVSFDGSFSFDLDGEVERYDWDFGDGTTGAGATTTHTYTDPGEYEVTLTAVDDMGATASATETVTVEGEPVDGGDGGNDGDEGDGGGGGGDDQNLGTCGSARETTTQTGTLGQAGDGRAFTYDTKTADPCEVEFDLTGPSGTDFDLYVTLDGSTPDTRNYDRRSFGYGSNESLVVDGVRIGRSSTFGVYVNSYSGSGQYELTIRESGRGLGGGNDPPEAVASVDQSSVEVGGFLEFDASDSRDSNGSIREFRWDMDDGTVENGESVVYSYTEPGRYDVELTVVDDGGATASDTVSVTVGNPENVGPQAAFTVERTTVGVGEEVSFDASPSEDPDGSIRRYEWAFEFDAAGTGQMVTHAFDLPGEYDVELTVTDESGVTDTTTKTITVRSGGGGGGGGGESCGDIVETDSLDGSVESTVDVARFEYTTKTADPCQVTFSMEGPSSADFDFYVTTDGRSAGPFDSDYSSTTPSNSERVVIEDVEAGQTFGLAVDSWGGTGRCIISVEEIGK